MLIHYFVPTFDVSHNVFLHSNENITVKNFLIAYRFMNYYFMKGKLYLYFSLTIAKGNILSKIKTNSVCR